MATIRTVIHERRIEGPAPDSSANRYAGKRHEAVPPQHGPAPAFINNRLKQDGGRGTDDRLNLVLEVSGQQKEKDAKVQPSRTVWVTGVTYLGTYGGGRFRRTTATTCIGHSPRSPDW